MSYTAIHEILYRDELGQTARVDPGAELTKDQEKALSKDLATLVKQKAIKAIKENKSKSPVAAAGKPGDGFGDK